MKPVRRISYRCNSTNVDTGESTSKVCRRFGKAEEKQLAAQAEQFAPELTAAFEADTHFADKYSEKVSEL